MGTGDNCAKPLAHVLIHADTYSSYVWTAQFERQLNQTVSTHTPQRLRSVVRGSELTLGVFHFEACWD